jgi:TRAP-type transport system periplasmic protein
MRCFLLVMLGTHLMIAPALADAPVTLRIGSEAPDGTAWAREMKAFARQVDADSDGQVRIKWYFSAIAGDDLQMGERLRRGQLDGVASPGILCQRLAPSLRVFYLPGLVQGRSESTFVIGQLKQTLDGEFAKSGFIDVGMFNVGPTLFFSRTPIRNMEDLRRTKFWVWELDEVSRAAMSAMGLHTVSLPLRDAGKAYEDGRTDAFLAMPVGALAFQWSAQARYVLDLRAAYYVGCLVVAARAFDVLPIEQQRILRAAIGKGIARMDELERQQNDALLGGLFERQGLHTLSVSQAFRSEFFSAARDMRLRLEERVVPAALIARVAALLGDFRAEHPSLKE